MDHLEKTIDLAKKNGLNRKFYKLANNHLEAIGKLTHTNPKQTAIFSLFLEKFGEYSIAVNDLAETLKCNTVQMIRYMDEIDILIKKKLLRQVPRYSNNDKPEYIVPLTVINSLRKNSMVSKTVHTKLTSKDFYDIFDDLFTKFKENDITRETLINELSDLCRNNRDIIFVKMLKKYNIKNNSQLIMSCLCNSMVNLDIDKVDFDDLSNVLEPRDFRDFQRKLKSKEHDLYKKGFIDFEFHKGLYDTKYCVLTQKAKDEFLNDVVLIESAKEKSKSFILADKIVEKKLFYNQENEKQIQELTTLLDEKNFIDVQNRLTKNGMRTGFACIFSGPPGTGKTETAYKIARLTKRDIFFVNISETKSCWFGESEKLIKEVFDKYRSYVKKCDIAPILLFNEADAVLGKRRDLNESDNGVGQTENAIQNIILQEMEDLNGILIATTNMTSNFDKAFERRFLYKIEFAKPSTEAKKLIWQSFIPDLSDHDALDIADQFDFSGGQIENIARKNIVSFILNGKKSKLSELKSLCKEEVFDKPYVQLGFRAKG